MLLARVYAVQGRQSEAIAASLKARELSDGTAFLPFLLGTLGFAYASSGDLANAHKVLEDLKDLETRGAGSRGKPSPSSPLSILSDLTRCGLRHLLTIRHPHGSIAFRTGLDGIK